jgi:lipopolysaccharide/colanic/teichoic acid biosynthesis glycosyltransferase
VSELGLLLPLAGALCAVVAAIFYSLAADEVRAWLPYLARCLVRSAARQLPPSAQARYERDWLAELAAWEDRPLSALAKAAHIRWAAKGIRVSLTEDAIRADALKRMVDLSGSALLLLLLAPVMVAVALAIRLESRGPVFFRTIRSGRGGEHFEMFKFRTMRGEASGRFAPDAKIDVDADPRVTGVGRFLRRYSLDELPQLFNVLRGDMSLVGPKPRFTPDTSPDDEPLRARSTVRPGITGPARLGAISGDPPPPDDAMRRDAEYVKARSLWLDIRLLARTIVVGLRVDGRDPWAS